MTDTNAIENGAAEPVALARPLTISPPLADDKMVHDAMTHWATLKASASNAVERCERAEAEANKLRGQNELLLAQKALDDNELRRLRAHVEELTAIYENATETVLRGVKRLRSGTFRRVGSIEVINGKSEVSIEDEMARRVGETFGANARPNEDGQ